MPHQRLWGGPRPRSATTRYGNHPALYRAGFAACRQTLSTSTRNGCSSTFAINKTSDCFLRVGCELDSWIMVGADALNRLTPGACPPPDDSPPSLLGTAARRAMRRVNLSRTTIRCTSSASAMAGLPGSKAGRLNRQVPGGRFLFGVGGGWNGAFPRERRPVGGNRAPAFQKRLGKSGAVGETGAVFRENCRSLRF